MLSYATAFVEQSNENPEEFLMLVLCRGVSILRTQEIKEFFSKMESHRKKGHVKFPTPNIRTDQLSHAMSGVGQFFYILLLF